MTFHGTPWHEDEIRQLIRLNRTGILTQEQIARELGRSEGAVKRKMREIRKLRIEELAKEIRLAWAQYARKTLGDKCPAGFTKSWEETGDWGREGNRVVAEAAIDFLLGGRE